MMWISHTNLSFWGGRKSVVQLLAHQYMSLGHPSKVDYKVKGNDCIALLLYDTYMTFSPYFLMSLGYLLTWSTIKFVVICFQCLEVGYVCQNKKLQNILYQLFNSRIFFRRVWALILSPAQLLSWWLIFSFDRIRKSPWW